MNPMTSAERDRAVAYLKETRAALVDSTQGLTEAQWRHRPSAEEWSIGDCVEHLAIVEASLLRGIQRMASAPAAPEDQIALAAGKEDLIAKAVPSRGRRVKGPPEAMPKGEWTDAETLLARFIEVRERVIVYAANTADPIRTRQFPHFFFGALDGFQWLIFMAAHSERHRKQLEEVKTSTGFPGSYSER
jgi:DinB superfamily